jgi:hypothetical protein
MSLTLLESYQLSVQDELTKGPRRRRTFVETQCATCNRGKKVSAPGQVGVLDLPFGWGEVFTVNVQGFRNRAAQSAIACKPAPLW